MLRPLVVIENAVLDAMAADPTFRTEFAGCLAGLVLAAPRAGVCPKCQKGRDPNAYAAAKNCLVGLPSESRDRLKALLSAQQVRVITSAGGRVREFNF